MFEGGFESRFYRRSAGRNRMSSEEFRGKEIIIYGAGHVGRKFCRALKAQGSGSQIKCFAVTGEAEEGALLDGIPLMCIYDIPIRENTLVCLAVHETLRDEMENIVKKLTKQYIWIYPHLYELMFGKPEAVETEIDISEILKTCRDDFRLAVRLAVMEQHDGKNTFGYDFYKRAQGTYCMEHTVTERLGQFIRLMEDWRRQGYRREYPLVLNRNYEVIDGNHRLAAAVYYRLEKILCNIYPTEIPLTEIHGKEPVMSMEMLQRHGFSGEEIEKLVEIQERYLRFYEK